jgi:hypothetical protein
MRRIHRHLTYANVISSLALFLVLSGGVVYAANTISSTDIIDGEVKNPDLAVNAVASSNVFPSTLIGADVATNTLTGSDIGPGAVASSEVADKSLGTTEFATSIPAARITRTSSQGINSLTNTKANFNSEDYDTAGLHSTSSNLDRLTAPVTGIYEVSAQIYWDVNSIGYRSICLQRNGSAPPCLARDVGTPVNGSLYQNVSTVERLTAGEYVDVDVYQTSGGLRTFNPEASMTWLAPGP